MKIHASHSVLFICIGINFINIKTSSCLFFLRNKDQEAQCPICKELLAVDLLQQHAATCGEEAPE